MSSPSSSPHLKGDRFSVLVARSCHGPSQKSATPSLGSRCPRVPVTSLFRGEAGRRGCGPNPSLPPPARWLCRASAGTRNSGHGAVPRPALRRRGGLAVWVLGWPRVSCGPRGRPSLLPRDPCPAPPAHVRAQQLGRPCLLRAHARATPCPPPGPPVPGTVDMQAGCVESCLRAAPWSTRGPCRALLSLWGWGKEGWNGARGPQS